jgi:GTPase SAR1 family protein
MEHLKVPTDCNSNKEYKLCILGEGGVGKSSLVRRNQ